MKSQPCLTDIKTLRERARQHIENVIGCQLGRGAGQSDWQAQFKEAETALGRNSPQLFSGLAVER